MTTDDDVPPGWLTQFRRGVLSGVGLLLLAVVICTVPAFAVWLVPGADTAAATSAVKAGALIALAAAGGGIRINGEAVTLTPLLVTAIVGWLIAGQARRSDSWSSVVGLCVGYGAASGVLAEWAQLGATRAIGMPSALAGFLLVAIIGGGARAADSVWPRLTARHRRIARASLAIVLCYLAAAAVLVAGSLAVHLSTASAMQRQLAPGASGLAVWLVGVAAAPNALLAGVGYLTGPGFAVGTHTSVSAVAVTHGPLPVFPLLAALPGSASQALGLTMVALVAAAAGWLCTRLVGPDGAVLGRLLDSVAAAVLAGGSLALLSACASGGIGTGSLAHVGSVWWAVGGCTMLAICLFSSLWLAAGLLFAHRATARRQAGAEPADAAPISRLRVVSSAPADRSEGRPARDAAAEPTRPASSDGASPAGEAGSRNVG